MSTYTEDDMRQSANAMYLFCGARTFLSAEMNFAKPGQESARWRSEVAADKNVRAPLTRYPAAAGAAMRQKLHRAARSDWQGVEVRPRHFEKGEVVCAQRFVWFAGSDTFGAR